MSSNGTRTKMDLTKLEATIEQLHYHIGEGTAEVTLSTGVIEEAVRLLEYFSEKTENNRLYHKKQNVKKRLAEQMLKKMLSKDELDELDKQAAAEIGDTNSFAD